MASFDIHLAIARKYITKHNEIINKEDFVKGNIAPDLVENKTISHYTGDVDYNDLIAYLEDKVHLEKYLKETIIDTDYERGVFLHLLTDYLFFNELFSKEYISNTNYHTFRKDLYYSYNVTNEYLRTKYDTDYGIYRTEIEDAIGVSRKQADYKLEERVNIIPFNDLDEFIENISNIDIDLYIENKKAMP